MEGFAHHFRPTYAGARGTPVDLSTRERLEGEACGALCLGRAQKARSFSLASIPAFTVKMCIQWMEGFDR